MNRNRDRFYAERDRRTVEYGIADPFEAPAAIVVAPAAAESIPGQVAALALINMAARLHRRLRILIPDVGLTVPALVKGTSLHDVIAGLVHEIDPFNDLVVTGAGAKVELPTVSIGVGPAVQPVLAVTADGFAARLGTEAASFGTAPSTVLGAAAAACLGAAALTQLSVGAAVAPVCLSLWDLTEGWSPGSADVVGPLDLGSVAVIGAGAVASALAYWARHFGVTGDWTFIDGDIVELHNTNRNLGLFARHAGWIDGEPIREPERKADLAAELLGACAYPGWYDDWIASERRQPDLVLPLANGPGLRAAAGQQGEPLLLHATTSENWTADLHRHLAEDDGCIACRLPESTSASLACSTSPLPRASGGSDAALPFLSGSSGLLLLAGLVHLMNGRLSTFDANHWQLHLDLGARHAVTSRTWPCWHTCTVRRNLPQPLRRRLPRGARWSHLD